MTTATHDDTTALQEMTTSKEITSPASNGNKFSSGVTSENYQFTTTTSTTSSSSTSVPVSTTGSTTTEFIPVFAVNITKSKQAPSEFS
jgi:alpha-L-arabinofuranosidase